MAQVTDSALTTAAGVIKNETAPLANTATRYGTILENIADSKINTDKISANMTTDTGSTTKVPTVVAVEAKLSALTKSSVGLANVDNTSDVNKPISNAQAALITALIPKRFVAYINQTFPNPPVATVLINTLGGTPVFTKTATGSFVMTLAGAFPAGKVFIRNGIDRPIINFSNTSIKIVQVYRSSDNTITFLTWAGVIGSGVLSDTVLSDFDLTIEVYP